MLISYSETLCTVHNRAHSDRPEFLLLSDCISSHRHNTKIYTDLTILHCYNKTHGNTRNTLDCVQSNYSSRTVFSRILIEHGPPTRNSAIRSADPENPTAEPNIKLIGWPLPISPFEIFPNESSVGRSVLNI